MIVVPDTTPLLALSRVDQLDVVRRLYGKVLVPREVRRELVERRPDAPGVNRLLGAEWIIVTEAPEATAELRVSALKSVGEPQSIAKA